MKPPRLTLTMIRLLSGCFNEAEAGGFEALLEADEGLAGADDFEDAHVDLALWLGHHLNRFRNGSRYPLGKTQRDVLGSLVEHRGEWSEGCGWAWDTPSNTRRLMDSLVARGLVERYQGNPPYAVRNARYTITQAGRATAQEKP